MTTNTEVKYFDSTMSGAPALSGTAGSLISVLDACLVNGFGSVTLDSLVIASNVATATVSTGHNFAMVGNTGPVVKIEGATPAELNGEFRIQSIADVNTFTFTTSGVANQTATGTISAKRAHTGFSKAFSGTNKAAYRSDDVAGTRLYLRADDSPASYPTLILYETMSDVDTGTGLTPTTGSLYFAKSNITGTTERPWKIAADSKGFYLLCASTVSNFYYSQLFFGDIVPFLSSDAYHAALIAHSAANYNSSVLGNLGNANASYLARSYTQLGGAVALYRYSHGKSGSTIGNSGAIYPNPPNNEVLFAPVDAWELSVARGMMPGLLNPLHNYNNLPENGVIDDAVSGKTVVLTDINNTAVCGLEITGPWR